MKLCLRYQTEKYWKVPSQGGELKLVLAWMEIHRDELLADWELAASGQSPYKIEPLK